MKEESIENKQLILIPKIEDYIEYMINVILKLPRTEKFNIGNEYKLSLYKMMYAVLYINKINRKKQVLEGIELLNKIDTELNKTKADADTIKNATPSYSFMRDLSTDEQKLYELCLKCN